MRFPLFYLSKNHQLDISMPVFGNSSLNVVAVFFIVCTFVHVHVIPSQQASPESERKLGKST